LPLLLSNSVLIPFLAECTPGEAFSILGEKAIFASGSPFHDVDLGDGKIGHSNQGNNMYLFPGLDH